jgi:hypothetical protein
VTLPFYFGRLRLTDVASAPSGSFVKVEAMQRIAKEIAAERAAAKVPFKPLR